jgi:hypothetical protein
METTAEIEHLQTRLRDEGARTAAFFAALPSAAWDLRVYSSGSAWRIRQVLAHFVSAERAYLHFMRDAVAGGPGVPRDFDIDAFNAVEVEHLADLTPGRLLEAFGEVRRETVEFVAGLRPADLDRIGYHPWFGDETMRFLLRLIYRHPMLHLRDVRAAMEKGSPLADGEGVERFGRPTENPGGADV